MISHETQIGSITAERMASNI